MIRPALADEAFLEDVARGRETMEGFRLWWLGQSGYLLQWQGRHLLLDPYLSESLTDKYAGTDRPHVRMTERIVAPDRLDFIDVVTTSHNHTDHLDAATLRPLLRANPRMRLVAPEANRGFVAERLGCDPAWPIGMDDGTQVSIAGIDLTGIAAAHEQLERDVAGRCRFLGYVIRFGPWCLYHSGDTVDYPELASRLARQRIDVALLPINGRAPERRVPGNLSGTEAATLAREAGVRLVIPCHYEMFEFNTTPPDAFRAEADHLGQPYRILRCGESWSSAEIGPPPGRG